MALEHVAVVKCQVSCAKCQVKSVECVGVGFE